MLRHSFVSTQNFLHPLKLLLDPNRRRCIKFLSPILRARRAGGPEIQDSAGNAIVVLRRRVRWQPPAAVELPLREHLLSEVPRSLLMLLGMWQDVQRKVKLVYRTAARFPWHYNSFFRTEWCYYARHRHLMKRDTVLCRRETYWFFSVPVIFRSKSIGCGLSCHCFVCKCGIRGRTVTRQVEGPSIMH